ncbi:unnamed protein product [Brassica oleracea]
MVLKTSGRNFIRFVHSHTTFQTNATRPQPLINATCRVPTSKLEMVTLIVATTYDPASINPATALLAMPGWTTGPILPPNIKSFTNQQTRLIQHDVSIVKEDDLDSRWEEATGEVVDEVIFLSRHTAASNRPALTVHPIGVLHLKEGESPPHGGKAGWAALPSPRIGPWLRLLKKMAEAHSLVPEFEITLEGTHHGPITSKPTMFLEIGDTEEYWKRQDAAQVIALLIWEGLGLGGCEAVGNWNSETGKRTVLLGIGGGHYAPRHVDVVFNACEVFYDTRSDDEWDKEDVENHSCGYSNETQKQLLDNSHDIVAKMNSLEKCSPNPLKTKSLKDRNCKLEDSELRNDPEANQDVEETSRDEVATSENVLKESLTLEDEQKPLNNSNKNNKRTPALKTELEETVDPEKAQEKFSSVSTKTSQGLFGETSFSAAEPVSGHITYSGQIVFSGSLSVRSDASTTSGRSFAFPVYCFWLILALCETQKERHI